MPLRMLQKLAMITLATTFIFSPTLTSFVGNSSSHAYAATGPTYIQGILVVNKTYSLPSTYAPGENKTARAAYEKMASAAKAQGLSMYVFSGYRSYSYQKTLYENYVKKYGQVEADRFSARPGHSEHQTGLAFDIAQSGASNVYAESAVSRWLAKNAYKYGFILRYPSGKEPITGYMYEPWHFRYLGVENATKVFNSGRTLEEFLGLYKPAHGGRYIDTPPSYWAYDEIVYLADAKIIGGYGDGSFRPSAYTTRAEAAKMMAIALRLPVSEKTTAYNDVSTSYWANPYIEAVTKAKLFSGTADQKFHPGKNITRAEIAKVMAKAFELESGGNLEFTDVSKTSWSYPFISSVVQARIASGYGDGTFRPSQPATRAHFAAFLARGLNEEFR